VRRVAALCALTLVGACGSSSAPSSHSAGARERTLTVFAASSLTKAFAAEGRAFEAGHPGVRVTFSFAGSQSLVAQIQQGAPADVLATADTTSMEAAKLSGARVFARNRLSIITAPGNPEHVATLADLARPGLRVVLAGPTVPVGKASAEALKEAGVTVTARSLEQDVKGVVSKVRLGEADAGIAYVTDVSSAGGTVSGTSLPAISNSYPAAVVRAGDDATAFCDFLLTPAGQSVLASFGFLPPA
jgi:molybdate transport system substrate-binding protein